MTTSASPVTREDLRALIRDVPDFPKPGITFKDITPLLADGGAFRAAVDHLAAPYRDAGLTRLVAIESRGFIFGAAVAVALGVGFVPVRKPGKLPWRRARVDYDLEYGTDAVEMHEDAIRPDDRVAIVDDVLATGGTAAATLTLVAQRGARVLGMSFLIELGFLGGRERLGDLPIHSVVTY